MTGHTPVTIVSTNGQPVVQVAVSSGNAMPGTVCTTNGRPIVLVSANGAPMVLYNENGTEYSAGGGVAPTNTVAPAVTGGAWLHGLLTTTDGTWTGDATIVYTYQWTRGGVDIGGATSNTYTLVAADRGTNVLCRVTGTNGAGNASANSNTIAVAAAGTNLLTKTEILSNAYWTKGNLTIGDNDTTAPDGAATADDVRETATTQPHEFYNTSPVTISNSTVYTLSIFVKPNERTIVQLNHSIGANARTWFDLTGAGSVLTNAGGSTAEIQALANGWYRISVTRTSSGTSAFAGYALAATDAVATYAGVAGSGMWFWGAQLEQAAAMTSYSAVA